MIPKISCQQCKSELSPGDQFCGNCGAKVEWGAGKQPPVGAQQFSPAREIVCPLCGQSNPGDAASCSSCGAAIGSQASSPPPARKQAGADGPQGHPLHVFQSWKIPAALALILIIVLAVVRFTQKSEAPQGMTANAQASSKEEESLQQAIDQNPKDDRALLRMANLYHDTKRYARAIMMYDRYLEINPSNPDARVDLGISYFEMGLMDTTNRIQYFTTAKDEMQKALTYNPKHQLAFYNLGMVNLHSGEIEEANTCFEKCAAIDTTSEVGKRAQQLVHQHSFTNPS